MESKDWDFAKIAEKNYYEIQNELKALEISRQQREKTALILKIIVWSLCILYQLLIFYCTYKRLKGF